MNLTLFLIFALLKLGPSCISVNSSSFSFSCSFSSSCSVRLNFIFPVPNSANGFLNSHNNQQTSLASKQEFLPLTMQCVHNSNPLRLYMFQLFSKRKRIHVAFVYVSFYSFFLICRSSNFVWRSQNTNVCSLRAKYHLV